MGWWGTVAGGLLEDGFWWEEVSRCGHHLEKNLPPPLLPALSASCPPCAELLSSARPLCRVTLPWMQPAMDRHMNQINLSFLKL